jgi:hypothetical protein
MQRGWRFLLLLLRKFYPERRGKREREKNNGVRDIMTDFQHRFASVQVVFVGSTSSSGF